MLKLSYLGHCTVYLVLALCAPPPVILVVKDHPSMNPWVLEKLPWFSF